MAELCIPLVSSLVRVGYPEKQRAAHPYCFVVNGLGRGTGLFAGDKLVLSADVDADAADWISAFADFGEAGKAPEPVRERASTMVSLAPLLPPATPPLSIAFAQAGQE